MQSRGDDRGGQQRDVAPQARHRVMEWHAPRYPGRRREAAGIPKEIVQLLTEHGGGGR
jgi:hypothetical protein